jgi:hypothetical protein
MPWFYLLSQPKSGGVEDSINEITGIKVNRDYTAIANSLLKNKK